MAVLTVNLPAYSMFNITVHITYVHESITLGVFYSVANDLEQ